MKKILMLMALVAMVFATGCKKEETYTVTFNANGGQGTMSPQTFTAEKSQALTANAFTYEGYAFAGWNTAADGSGTAYTDQQTVTVTENMTLYAQWTARTITVTFDPNGGTGEMQPQAFAEGVAQALTANAFTREHYDFGGWNTSDDGTGTAYTDQQEVTLTENLTLYAQWSNSVNGHEWVDLGLPSGKLWATCNVGANSPDEYGDYFAWGETQPQADNAYSWTSYKYANGTSWEDPRFTKYCSNSSYGDNGFTDTLTVLLPEDDAATANWGAGWRMPTKAEFQELLDNCTLTWTTQNDVDGGLFTSSNGNSIFLPAAGDYMDGGLSDVSYVGRYWTSELDTDRPYFAWNLNGGSVSSMDYNVRRYGYSVRPVCSVSQK